MLRKDKQIGDREQIDHVPEADIVWNATFWGFGLEGVGQDHARGHGQRRARAGRR